MRHGHGGGLYRADGTTKSSLDVELAGINSPTCAEFTDKSQRRNKTADGTVGAGVKSEIGRLILQEGNR